MSLRNIFAEIKSDVIGNCTKASPAKTINPTLSLSKERRRSSISNLLLSKREGITLS